MISHKNKFVFVHINKTGGTSIINMLKEFDDKAIIRKGHPFLYRSVRPLIRGKRGKALPPILAQSDKFDNYFKFTFVRNPWDRMVSLYFHIRRQASWLPNGSAGRDAKIMVGQALRKMSFNDWILGEKEYSFKSTMFIYPQLDWVLDQNQKIGANFIGRLETFRKDFFYVCDKIKTQRPKVLRHSKNRRGRFNYMVPPYWEHYNDESIEVVRNVYKKDIDYFGYQFGK